MPRSRLSRAVLALVAVSMLGACDVITGLSRISEDPDEGADGSFTASVTGSVTENLNGSARFDTSVSGQWFILLGDSEADNIRFFHTREDAPSVRTYQIGLRSELPSGHFTDAETAEAYLGGSGTLQITSVSAGSIQGVFEFDALNVAGSRTVTVSGSFTAVPFN